MRKYGYEVVFALLCLVLGIWSGYGVKASDSSWFLHLHKPSFNPPSWVFAPVWSVLYVMMGVAFGKMWKLRDGMEGGVWLFILQFIINLAWTPLFFVKHRIDLALCDISLIWLCMITIMFLVRKNRIIFWLFVPYLLWISFATILNFELYRLNVI